MNSRYQQPHSRYGKMYKQMAVNKKSSSHTSNNCNNNNRTIHKNNDSDYENEIINIGYNRLNNYSQSRNNSNKNYQKLSLHNNESDPIQKDEILINGIRIKKFDPATIRPNSVILFVGSTGTGKSFCLRDILYHLRGRFFDGHVWSGSNEEDNPWTDHFVRKDVHLLGSSDNFPVEELGEVLDLQEERKHIAQKYGKPCPPTVVVLEDLEYLKKKVWNLQPIRHFMLAGRHKRVYALCAFQYVMSINLEMRQMFTYAFLSAETTVQGRERLFKCFGGYFNNYADFNTLFIKMTQNYGVMVIDLRCRTYNISDAIFYYKAKPHGKFKVGVPSLWKRYSIPPTPAPSTQKGEREREKKHTNQHSRQVKKQVNKQVPEKKKNNNNNNPIPLSQRENPPLSHKPLESHSRTIPSNRPISTPVSIGGSCLSRPQPQYTNNTCSGSNNKSHPLLQKPQRLSQHPQTSTVTQKKIIKIGDLSLQKIKGTTNYNNPDYIIIESI